MQIKKTLYKGEPSKVLSDRGIHDKEGNNIGMSDRGMSDREIHDKGAGDKGGSDRGIE